MREIEILTLKDSSKHAKKYKEKSGTLIYDVELRAQ
jgi:hypothetical protein